MDRPDDRGGALIGRNRLLLASAAEARAWARDAIERAQEAVQSTMKVRLAWALVRQRRDDLPQSPDLT
jgi:hypothetical protein